MRNDLNHAPVEPRIDYLKFSREELVLFFNTSRKSLFTVLSIGVALTISTLWKSYSEGIPVPRSGRTGPGYQNWIAAKDVAKKARFPKLATQSE
jgi:hypothetical protein